MDRATRDKFASSTDQKDLLYGETACLETPPDLFQALNDEFHFDFDLCANEQNHLLPRWFGPGGIREDALTASWASIPPFNSSRCGFCNPPYGAFIPDILNKALQEQRLGFTSVFLLPLRASAWYLHKVLPFYSDLRHLPRVKFWYQGQPKLQLNTKNGKMESMTALFDSIVVVYQGWKPGEQHQIPFGPRPRFWTWKPERPKGKSRKPYAESTKPA